MVAPTISNIAKHWLLQNEVNCDFYDSSIGALTGKSYTPSFSPSGTNLGDTGKVSAFYTDILGHIYLWGLVAFEGTGIDIPTGNFEVELDVAINAAYSGFVSTTAAQGMIVGVGNLHDSSLASNRQTLMVQARTLTRIGFVREYRASGGQQAYDNDNPIVFNSGDFIKWFARYPR